MAPRAERAQDVAAVKLTRRQKVQGGGKQSYPRGAAYWMQKQCIHRGTRMKELRQNVKNQRHSENHIRIGWIGQARALLSQL